VSLQGPRGWTALRRLRFLLLLACAAISGCPDPWKCNAISCVNAICVDLQPPVACYPDAGYEATKRNTESSDCFLALLDACLDSDHQAEHEVNACLQSFSCDAVADGGYCGPQALDRCAITDAGFSAPCAAATKAQIDLQIGCPSCGTPGAFDCTQGFFSCCENLTCRRDGYCCRGTYGVDDTCVSEFQCCTFKCCPPSANGRSYCALPDGGCVP
jgi:hypothetical protein